MSCNYFQNNKTEKKAYISITVQLLLIHLNSLQKLLQILIRFIRRGLVKVQMLLDAVEAELPVFLQGSEVNVLGVPHVGHHHRELIPASYVGDLVL